MIGIIRDSKYTRFTAKNYEKNSVTSMTKPDHTRNNFFELI